MDIRKNPKIRVFADISCLFPGVGGMGAALFYNRGFYKVGGMGGAESRSTVFPERSAAWWSQTRCNRAIYFPSGRRHGGAH